MPRKGPRTCTVNKFFLPRGNCQVCKATLLPVSYQNGFYKCAKCFDHYFEEKSERAFVQGGTFDHVVHSVVPRKTWRAIVW